ncbi:MAG: DNA polymerase I, partial [Deltaproteobacteria bacterium]|nr:DNA polymerase I [Deltaproteobacteria bacterium]
MTGPVYLMDASTFIHRSYHVLKDMVSSQGQPTGAIFGFTGSLLSLLRTKEPASLAVVYDSPAPGRRKKIFPGYKASRGPMDPALISQQEPIRDIVRYLGIFGLVQEGLEADDLIWGLCRQITQNGGQAVIVSPDKDFYQLLSEDISMYDPSPTKKSALDLKAFRETFGLEPPAFLEMQALMGDKSDDIPGVPQIGKITAHKLIAQFGTLENLDQNLDQVKSETQRRLLKEHESQARLSRELARLGGDDVQEIDLSLLKRKEPDLAALKALFRKLTFRSFSQELDKIFGSSSLFDTLPGQVPAAAKAAGEPDLFSCCGPQEADTGKPGEPGTAGPAGEPGPAAGPAFEPGQYLLAAAEDLETVRKELESAPEIALCLTLASAKSQYPAPAGLALAAGSGRAWYLPLAHTGQAARYNLDKSLWLDTLGPILRDPGKKLLACQAKSVWLTLSRFGLSLPAPSGDPELMAYLLDPASAYETDYLAEKFLSYQTRLLKDIVPKKSLFEEINIETASAYAGERALLAVRLAEVLLAKLQEDKNKPLLNLYQKVELPLTDLLMRMELAGIRLDQSRLTELAEELDKEISAREAVIYKMAGGAFNLGSPKQVGEILFGKMQLASGKKTAKKTGYSTDAEVLSELAHPIGGEILAWREYVKLKNTYVDKLPQTISESDKRIHTSFNQTQTATGRLSSSDPNLQNIPARSREGRIIRSAFAAEEGCLLVGADYSQIELRIMAHFSQDKALLEAFRNDEDIHTQTASQIYRLEPDQVTREQRREAKTINFGVIYGQGPFGLAKQLKINQQAAKLFIELYFQKFTGVQIYMDTVTRKAKEDGLVTTWCGRVRYLPALTGGGFQAMREAERMAVNTPIQGTAADIIKMAMLAVDRRLKAENLASRLILQVHDELVVEAP